MGQVISTHHLFKKLKESGFNEQQAETILETIITLQAARIEVSHNGDTSDSRLEAKALKEDITAVKADLKVLKWGVALILAVVAMPLLKGIFG